MKQILTYITICLVFFFACSNNSEANINNRLRQDTSFEKSDETANATEKALQLDTFSKAPAGLIDGCEAGFATDSLNYAAGLMIYMSNLGENRLIKINNHFILLKELGGKKKEKADTDKIYTETLTGEGYTITIKTGWLKNDGDELSIYVGTIEITDGKKKRIYRVFGGIGC